MKKLLARLAWFVYALLWAFLLGCVPANGSVYQAASLATVAVKDTTSTSSGAGILVDGNVVVSCLHVVPTSTDVWVGFSNGRIVAGKVTERDEKNDLILIKIENGLPHPTVRINLRPLELGQGIFTIGHPNGMMWSLSKGYVMSTDERRVNFGTEGFKSIIQADMTGYGGSSGGGVYNERGELVGIMKGRLDETSITFFTPASALCKKLMKCEVR